MSEVYRYRAGPALPLAGGGIVITAARVFLGMQVGNPTDALRIS
jgi:hypothetical protein